MIEKDWSGIKIKTRKIVRVKSARREPVELVLGESERGER